MSLNVRLQNAYAADFEERSAACSIMFLKKYTKTHDITVKISHIICFYLYIHKKPLLAAKNRLLELNSTTFLLQIIEIMRCYYIYAVMS